MNHREQAAIRENYCSLVANMEPASVLDYLYQEQVFTLDDYEEILAYRVRQDQCREMLRRIFRKSPKQQPYTHLTNALKLENEFLAERIQCSYISKAKDCSKSNSTQTLNMLKESIPMQCVDDFIAIGIQEMTCDTSVCHGTDDVDGMSTTTTSADDSSAEPENAFIQQEGHLTSATQVILSNPISCRGKTAGWIYVDQAKEIASRIMLNHPQTCRKLREEAIDCYNRALAQFEEDSSKDGPFGYAYASTCVASLLLGCGAMMEYYQKFQPSREEIQIAQAHLSAVENITSHLNNIARLSFLLATSDLHFRKHNAHRALDYAREAVPLAESLELPDELQSTRIRYNLYKILAEREDQLKDILESNGIKRRWHEISRDLFPENNHQNNTCSVRQHELGVQTGNLTLLNIKIFLFISVLLLGLVFTFRLIL